MPIKIKRLPAVATASAGMFGLFAFALAPAAAQATTFTSTGSEQAYVVPAGVTEVAIDAIGAPGGIGCLNTTGGLGGEITADFAVNPGSVLYVEVGGPGTAAFVNGFCTNGISSGGFDGGGSGNAVGGGGGGGASDVRTVPMAVNYSAGSRLIVAGGGGGAGSIDGGGGNAGSTAPGDGGGGAGTLSAGGAAGNSSACSTAATAGSFGVGGTGGSASPNNGGGGGGGGYWGGGGGGCTAGQNGWGAGGGSSYVAPSAINATNATTSTNAPSVTITPQTPPAPPQGPTGPQGQTGAPGATGHTGATGATGATGVTGATGPQGPAGKIELVVCKKATKTVKSGGHKRRVTVQKCTTKLVSGTVKFTVAGGDLGASVSRAHVVYATGVAVPDLAGHWQLVFNRHVRKLRPGRYTLTLRTLRGQHRVVERTTITIA
jgi:hypothetical protein